MKAWIAFWIGALGLLAGLVFWNNCRIYKAKRLRWKLGKSLADWAIIVLLAARLPALLIGWSVLWVVRPVKHPAIRTTMAVLAGLAFSLVGAKAIELLIVSSVFSIDLITGRAGFLGNWDKAGPTKPQKIGIAA